MSLLFRNVFGPNGPSLVSEHLGVFPLTGSKSSNPTMSIVSFPILIALVTPVVYHLHGNSGDSIRKVNGTSIFRRPNRNFSGMNGLFEKVVPSYRLERFNR